MVSKETKRYLRRKVEYFTRALSVAVSRPWSDLRGISNSYAAKSTILIPLVGYWIIFNESVFTWLQLAQQIGGYPPSDQTRVRWLYLGLCSIALATFIYAWRCPREIKKYGDYKDYLNGDKPAISRDEIDTIRGELEMSGYSEVRSASEGDVLTIYYMDLDNSEWGSRVAATALFAIGFLILAWLSLRVFAMVVLTWSTH